MIIQVFFSTSKIKLYNFAYKTRDKMQKAEPNGLIIQ